MKLFVQETRYKTYECLCSFISLSNTKVNTQNDNTNMSVAGWLEMITTSFNFGRRSGHTTACVCYLDVNPDAIMYVRNKGIIQHIRAHMPNAQLVEDRIRTISVKPSRLPLSYKTFIFDCISYSDAIEYMSNMINNGYIKDSQIKAIVIVGS